MSLTAVTWAAASKFPRAAGFSKTLTVYALPKYPHVPRIRAIACITSMFVCCKAPARGLGRASKSVRSLRFSSQTARTESYNSTDRGQLSRFDDTAHGPKSSVTPFSTNTLHRTAHARKQYSPAKERQRAERDQLTRLLKDSPGKRDARNFLKQFDTPMHKKSDDSATAKAKPGVLHSEWGTTRTGVNLGSLYQPTIFTRDPLPEKQYGEEEEDEPLHLALIKLRQPQMLDDQTLGGIALTLSQMARLGLKTTVILDCDVDATTHAAENKLADEAVVWEQAARLEAALEDYNEPGALLVEQALSCSDHRSNMPSTVHVRGGVEVDHNFLLYPLLDDGVIPIIPPFAYDGELKRARVGADDVLLALVREFAGIAGQTGAGVTDTTSKLPRGDEWRQPCLDRIIILDPLGGVPSANRSDGAHVFVNLEAEYRDIKQELQQLSLPSQLDVGASAQSLAISNPFSKFGNEDISLLPSTYTAQIDAPAPARHLNNLDVVQRALKLLPQSSSGLIITPSEAATKAIPDNARTTPSKNPLLHNLLTDKPMISSSLPTSPASRFLGSAIPNPATFLKKGVPLTMIPDPRVTGPWLPPSASNPSIDLANDPRINFPKLELLINDSFRRKLHAKDYLARIHGRVAGIIIAGDYEGGAICTWETPSSLRTTSIPPQASDTPDSPYWVPYLDKFAVLTSSQGSGGVSDIVWAALTRSCFPAGVVWRSRTSNPVNKWYQERSTGTWNLPGGAWTMFWTTGNVTEKWDGDEWGLEQKEGVVAMARWDAYVDVCKGIEPSWADGIQRLD
jgi:amino-acid N-acetyltransferase